MEDLIQFLDLHSGSLTVLVAGMSMLITLVYVVATIFICRANIRSAEATRAQVAEARRQYEEEHRPYIAYQFIYERRTWYGMRFTNYGRRVATHVRICLEKEFLDSITEGTFYKGLYDLQSKEFVLGIGQSYDIFFGADDFRRRQNKCPIRGTIAYHDATLEENYIEAFEVDFEKYGSIFSVNTLADDLHLDMKRQTEELQKIGKSISELKKVHTDVQGKTVPEKEVCQGLLKELAARRCGEDGQAGRSRNGNQCEVGSETR